MLLLRFTPSLAQTTPTLEFAAGAGNPTSNGPSVTNQVITFQNNTNSPGGNTFTGFTPATTAAFSLSNQQYTLPTTQLSTGLGVAFGTRINTSGAAPVASGLFQTVDAIGSSGNANYTSANGVNGGIDVAANMAVELFTSAQPLPATVPANARYRYADLVITFSQPTVNPLLEHVQEMVVFGLLVLVRRINTKVQGHKIAGFATARHQIDQADARDHAMYVA